ncbi:MAG: Lrp/AsnC family transcriptional regulator [Alphaproteobacteria bacterium]|nr:Lrp/AsnC family transcriptional regulator [Alphaproteobacteria bacterium]
MPYAKIDRFDKAILGQLQADSRLTFNEIGERVGLSPSACHKRVKAMEEAGLIAGYVAIVAEEQAQLRTSVFVQISLASQKQEVLEAFERAVSGHEEIMECFLMAGLSDYLLRVLCRDGEDYERLHNTILVRLPGVERVVSNFAIRKVLRRTAVPLSRTGEG